ncbi:hypothetical protein J6T66_00985 [bacterium]|nr:hypothetical protein [bacterium]
MYNDCFISHRYCDTGVYNTTVTYDFSYYDESCVDLLGNNTNNTCDD